MYISYLHVQSQQKILHQNNMSNIFKVNNKTPEQCLLLLLLKDTFSTKLKLPEMCHLTCRLIFLFQIKVMFHSQDIQVFVFLTNP